MKVARLETADGRVVCERLELADSFWTRFRGLMGRPSIEPGQGMLFRPGGSVHMFFMRFPLDVVFCDRDLRVVKVVRDLAPWRVAGARGARVTVELAPGEADARGVEVGTQLRVAD